jgi:hypothetical protein
VVTSGRYIHLHQDYISLTRTQNPSNLGGSHWKCLLSLLIWHWMTNSLNITTNSDLPAITGINDWFYISMNQFWIHHFLFPIMLTSNKNYHCVYTHTHTHTHTFVCINSIHWLVPCKWNITVIKMTLSTSCGMEFSLTCIWIWWNLKYILYNICIIYSYFWQSHFKKVFNGMNLV